MFLVGDGRNRIEEKLRGYLSMEASVGLVLAAIYFEWTVGRALICLGSRPNIELRDSLQKCHGLQAYKKLWASEIESPRLPEVTKDWHAVTEAFQVRNVLVHGRERYTNNMAYPHFEAILNGAKDLWEFCRHEGFDLANRLPVRKSGRKTV